MRGGALDTKVSTADPGKSNTLVPSASSSAAFYEKQLDANLGWALSEGSRFFQGKSLPHDALRKITGRLKELGIPYAVAGGMALFMHGYRRFTDDVDLLVTREGLKLIHEKLSGLGYVPPFNQSKNLRDAELGVRIEFLVTGDYPGDGKPKPVAFPDPETVAVEREGIKYLSLPSLIALKLASARMKDLADVQELIKLIDLKREFSESIDPSVRPRFDGLWNEVHQTKKRYKALWKFEDLTSVADGIDEMVGKLESTLKTLRQMRADGVTLEASTGRGDADAYLVTEDPDVAKKYDMHNEDEFLEAGDEVDEGEI